uniref:Uncharacterized protein n=1 Tax=Nelumbo nucifera TaxID=4432 RepID=A0A822XL60_NELNU|nr:TPA_asm: hypothetical protein HUJ06_022195 [Nelumbo nucifera]
MDEDSCGSLFLICTFGGVFGKQELTTTFGLKDGLTSAAMKSKSANLLIPRGLLKSFDDNDDRNDDDDNEETCLSSFPFLSMSPILSFSLGSETSPSYQCCLSP